jgi:tRNA (mo5U34)-methyltransferase
MTSWRERIDDEPYWFLRMDLGNGVVTPGWSDPARDKLPFFGLPAHMGGMRVLDVGCAEGFFSFEAERRGAAEVVSLDFDADCVRRFALCAEALGSRNVARVMSVYDLDPSDLGTFDLVMFFGLLYHLPDPLLVMKKVAAMASGTVLVQSWSMETRGKLRGIPLARFYPQGLSSGPKMAPIFDPTVYWQPNAACISALMEHVGLVNIERLPAPSDRLRSRFVRWLRPRKYALSDTSIQFRASVSERRPGASPRHSHSNPG